MKKALKIVACLLIALTVALATNVSNASAQPAACDKSTTPTCRTELYPGDCQDIPLPGYDVSEINISFSPDSPVPMIYPPPKMYYNIEVCGELVSAQLELTSTATYDFNAPYSCDEGRVCNGYDPIAPGYPMQFDLTWKNIPPK